MSTPSVSAAPQPSMCPWLQPCDSHHTSGSPQYTQPRRSAAEWQRQTPVKKERVLRKDRRNKKERKEPLCHTSFWMVSFTLTRLEWGSVQMNPASTRRTFERPLRRLRQSDSSSLDSRVQNTHCPGGCRYRSQNLQKCTVACLGIPSVMSTSFLMQSTHMLAALGGIAMPH